MKLWAALRNAVAGWVLILRGQDGWRDRFSLTAPGLVSALFIFAFVAFLAVAFASTSIGMPNAYGVAAAMFVLALPVIAFLVALLGTRMLLKSDEAMLPLLVPGSYALTAFLLTEGLLALIGGGGPVVMLSWLALGYMLFRLARSATAWNIGVAAAFAVLTVLLLVLMRSALYMLSSFSASSI